MKILLIATFLLSTFNAYTQEVHDSKFLHEKNGEYEEAEIKSKVTGFFVFDQGIAKDLHTIGFKGGMVANLGITKSLDMTTKGSIGYQTGNGVNGTYYFGNLDFGAQQNFKNGDKLGLLFSGDYNAFRTNAKLLEVYYKKELEKTGICVVPSIAPIQRVEAKLFGEEKFTDMRTSFGGTNFGLLVSKKILKDVVTIIGDFEMMTIRDIKTFEKNADERTDVESDGGSLYFIDVGLSLDCSKLSEKSNFLENLDLKLSYVNESGRYSIDGNKTKVVVVPDMLQLKLVKKF